MKKILFRKTLRDLKDGKARYAALALLLVFSVYIVVSLVGAADTVINQTEESNRLLQKEDGQFTTFTPLSDEEIARIEKKGVTLEKHFSMDFSGDDTLVFRLYQQREVLDQITFKEGRLAEKSGEAVLERRFAEVHETALGDTLTLGGKTFTVTGIGTTPDYNAPYKNLGDTAVDSENFGLVFVTPEDYDALRDSGKSLSSEDYCYAFQLENGYTAKELKNYLKTLDLDAESVADPYFQDYWDRTLGKKDELLDGMDELRNGSRELSDALNELSGYGHYLRLIAADYPELSDYADNVDDIAEGANELADALKDDAADARELADSSLSQDTGNLQMFLEEQNNVRIDAAADDVSINRMAGLVAGVLLMILFSYVISIFVIHSIDRESTVIGALYSLGVRQKELILHYILLPVVLCFAGGAIGLFAALTPAGIRYQMMDSFLYYSMPEMTPEISPLLIVYSLLAPPLIAAIVNTLVIRKRLGRPPLALLRNEPKASRARQVRLKEMGFLRMFRTRQMLREVRASLTVVFGLFLCLLLAMIAIYCYVYCDKVNDRMVADTHYEYMYSYKYPTETVPHGGYPAVAENLSKSFGEYEFDVTLLGITSDDPFFDIEEMPDNAQEVVLGSSFARKYGLKTGDEFTVTDGDNDRLYGFKVAGVTEYCPSHMIFMDIDALRDLYGLPDDYFNVVFSDKELNIPGGRLYSVTSRADIQRSAGVFSDLMRPMVIVMSAASALIFLVVMYLMMKMMLDRSAFHISMVRIFGFRPKEVKKMYLDGNFFVVAVGALIAIPLTKLIMNVVFPKYLVANVSIAFEPSFPWYYYPGIYGIILLMYFLISGLLMRRIRSIIPAEVLKNRE